MRTKIHNVLKLIGKRPKDLGAHMYNAATGVVENNREGKEKRHRLMRAFNRQRLMDKRYDEGLHMYSQYKSGE